jgi:ATP-dependent helicase/nuclease subunit B
VLPGLDHALDEEAWSQLAKKPDTDGTAGHPQKALANLLARLRVVRDDVRNLGTVHDAVAGRMEFLTQALLPAEATDRWNDYRKNHDDADMARALAGISYIDAANERQEALAIAIALRQALEIVIWRGGCAASCCAGTSWLMIPAGRF